MFNGRTRWILTLAAVGGLVLVWPAETQAGPLLDYLFGGWSGGVARTTYMPPYCGATYGTAYSAPVYSGGCAPCAAAPPYAAMPARPAQTCYYLPQTCYRTVYQPVAVASCMATPGCDPCARWPVTVFRPVAGWAYQARLVPYATYRVVYANPCVPGVVCSPSVGYGPPGYTLPAPACGSCLPGVTMTVPPAAATAPYTMPFSAPQGAPPTGVPLSPSTAPSSEAAPGARTFIETPPAATESQRPLSGPELPSNPPSVMQQNSTPAAPRLVDPNDREASTGAPRAMRFRLVAVPRAEVPPQPAAADDGLWRPARD